MDIANHLLRLIVVILTIQLTFLPVSFALKVQINSDIKLREQTDQSMERIGLLKKGTTVEIPDEFTVNTHGKPDLELTLNNWLRNGGHRSSQKLAADGGAPGLFDYDGDRSDYFFPVRVISPFPGSTVRRDKQNVTHFIALKHLVRTGNAFIVSEDTNVHESPVPASKKNEVDSTPSQMEASSHCANGLCSRPSDASTPVRELIAKVSPGLASAAQVSGQLFKRTQNDLGHVYKNFGSTCGFNLSDFIPVIKSRATQAGIPADLLLALMTQESSGRCYALNSETDSSQSVGLFQINSTHNRFPRCSTEQKNILKGLHSVARLATGPRCLENPLINLDESIRILKGAQATLASGTKTMSGFDFSQLDSTDLWRMTVSSYNGGARWVLQAKQDLLRFNERNGTNLSPYNWEDLRIFYMRMWLNRDQQNSSFGAIAGGRSQNNSVANLTYVENVVGRQATTASRPGLTEAWGPTVKN